jgi:hypothetical protein
MIVRVYQFAARMDRAITDFTLTIVASQSFCTNLPTIAVTSRWLRSRLCAIPVKIMITAGPALALPAGHFLRATSKVSRA